MKLDTTTKWLRTAPARGKPGRVDRENKILEGYVVAQKGNFKSRRGQFDDQSLGRIVQLMKDNEPRGTKSRFTHPNMSDDGLGKFLGRAHNARLDPDGGRVRADLHLSDSASHAPAGDLADYVMRLAEEDSDALSSSLVVEVDRVSILDSYGRPKKDESGEPVPDLWLPTRIHSSDLVDEGDAVDGLLSAGIDVDRLPLSALWRGAELVDEVFAGQPREVVEARLQSWLQRYLDDRYGCRSVRAGRGTPASVLQARRELEALRKGKAPTTSKRMLNGAGFFALYGQVYSYLSNAQTFEHTNMRICHGAFDRASKLAGGVPLLWRHNATMKLSPKVQFKDYPKMGAGCLFSFDPDTEGGKLVLQAARKGVLGMSPGLEIFGEQRRVMEGHSSPVCEVFNADCTELSLSDNPANTFTRVAIEGVSQKLEWNDWYGQQVQSWLRQSG